jgi:hypothetical protein
MPDRSTDDSDRRAAADHSGDSPASEPVRSDPAGDAGDGTAAGYEIPPGATVAACPYCDARFPNATLRALHWERAHDDELTADERQAAATARDDETEGIRHFRLLALGALVLLYFGLVIAYSVFA